jgi:Spy/CpxP family protein refolding chaperone
LASEREELSVALSAARSDAERANAAVSEMSQGSESLAAEVANLRAEMAGLHVSLARAEHLNENEAVRVRALAHRVDSALGILKGLVDA